MKSLILLFNFKPMSSWGDLNREGFQRIIWIHKYPNIYSQALLHYIILYIKISTYLQFDASVKVVI